MQGAARARAGAAEPTERGRPAGPIASPPGGPAVLQRIVGVVERITFHDPATGWSVVKVSPMGAPHTRITVTMHQIAVTPGATMELHGAYESHPRFGEQFRCRSAVERKPATAAALERYLGSGLISGIGPKTAKAIVRHFGDATLDVLESEPQRLLEVRGIASGRLERIAAAWREHRAIRDVMLFLQEHGVSTLFATRIFARWGESAIEIVRRDPYRLARDVFGIGFFTADRVARCLGFAEDGEPRLSASVRHVLDASREAGHCYLRAEQVHGQVLALLSPPDPEAVAARVDGVVARLVEEGGIRVRHLPLGPLPDSPPSAAYYARSLHRAEESLARLVAARVGSRSDARRTTGEKARAGETDHATHGGPMLSLEQADAIRAIVRHRFSVLTGGPGCGKTTTLRALVSALRAAGRHVTLAAPTGRAAQRMSEVVGIEARTVHRLLEWDPKTGGFRRGPELPIPTDFLVVDEVSMLDVTLAAALLAAVPDEAQVLFIGDPDQLPSVGPGRVLADLLDVPAVPRFHLTQVFRQAAASEIIRFAHAILAGQTPDPWSPIDDPHIWKRGVDCLFVDAEVATAEELKFVGRAKAAIARVVDHDRPTLLVEGNRVVGRLRPTGTTSAARVVHERHDDQDDEEHDERFAIPRRFLHVDLEALARSESGAQDLRAVLRRIHPSSAVHYGLSLPQAVVRLYAHTLPRHLGPATEVQVLAPMHRGSVGADALNRAIQAAVNPPRPGVAQLQIGDRVLRVGDRVIQRKNDYDLGVFNGDIGRIVEIDALDMEITVRFPGSQGSQSGQVGQPGDRTVVYRRDALAQLALAYAITIHKAQGSEFPAVIIPIALQHHTMLFRDLVYTALTRARRMAVFVGSRRALRIAVDNVDPRRRQTALSFVLDALLR